MNEELLLPEHAQGKKYDFEQPVARILASTLNPNNPNLGREITVALDNRQDIADVLLPPDNELVKQTEYLFDIEPSQFASFAQPYVEAITNEAEAQRKDGNRVKVDVHLDTHQISIAGNGKGMDFQHHFIGQVIRPHSGDEGKLRGQFGQGTLSYWMASENVRIVSIPEEDNARGFEVELRNNSHDANKGKTVAGSLVPNHQERTSGTQVIFDRPHFNGKPLEQEHLHRIASYIQEAVKNIYYAEIHIHLNGDETFVNQTAIEAERVKVDDIEILFLQGKGGSESSYPIATHIDVVGETLWSNQFNEQQSGIILNLPRQVMKAEARSLRHVELREKDLDALYTLVQESQSYFPEASKRAHVLASLSETINILNIPDQAKKQIHTEVVLQIAICLETKQLRVFTSGVGQEKIVLPSNTILLPPEVSQKLPEKHRNSALEHVSGYSHTETMYLSEFRAEYSQDFFIRVGNIFCLNKNLLGSISSGNDYQIENALIRALNTAIKLYNLSNPAEADQIRGYFHSLQLGEATRIKPLYLDSTKEKSKHQESAIPQPEKIPSDTPFSLEIQALEQLAPTTTPEEPNSEIVEYVLESTNSEHWQSALKQYLQNARSGITSNHRQLLQDAKYDLTSKYPSDYKPDISENQLIETKHLFVGEYRDQENILELVSHLNEQQLLTYTSVSGTEVFAPFLHFFAQTSSEDAGILSLLLNHMDSQYGGSAWKADNDYSVEVSIHNLLVESAWLVHKMTSVFFNERFAAGGLNSTELRYAFCQKLKRAWAAFAQSHPSEVHQVRFNLQAKKAAHRLDGLIVRNRVLNENQLIRNRFANVVEHEQTRWKTQRLYGIFKPSEVEHITIDSESKDIIIKDEEYVYFIYDLIQKENEGSFAKPETVLDVSLHIIALVYRECGLDAKQLWIAHENSERLGIPSFIRRITRSNGYGSDLRLVDQDRVTLEYLHKEHPADQLQVFKSVFDLLINTHPTESEYELHERKVVLLSLLCPILGDESSLDVIQKRAAVLAQIYQNNQIFRGSSSDHHPNVEILYLLQDDTEEVDHALEFLSRHPQALGLITKITNEFNIFHRHHYRTSASRYKIVPRIIIAVELIIEKLPPGVGLENIDLVQNSLSRKKLVIRQQNEETEIPFDNALIELLLTHEHLQTPEWVVPEDSISFEGDIEILQAAYLGIKAEGRNTQEVSLEEIRDRFNQYQSALQPDQRKMYKRRLLSSIQSQDADHSRFYREWFQNSQNALANREQRQKGAITHVGFTADMRRFTKVVDFIGMPPETAIWNLGTAPGYKEGEANEGSLERFHTGWLTCLNGAHEVRVKTSIGDGRVTYRQFHPIYETTDDGSQRLIQVEQKTWVVSDPRATFGFTEMTRFEHPGTESYTDFYENRSQAREIATYHHRNELTMYTVNSSSSYDEQTQLGVDYSLESLSLLREQISRSQERVADDYYRSRRKSDFNLEVPKTPTVLAHNGQWGVDVISSSYSQREHKLVQGGFPIGDRLPPAIESIIPQDILNAFRQAKCDFILRIPPDIRLNKGRDSINDIDAFIEKSRSQIIGALIEGLAKAMMLKHVDVKILLSYDSGKHFMRQYQLSSEQQKSAIENIRQGDYSQLEWILQTQDPMTEITKLAFNLPVAKIPDELAGLAAKDSVPNYSIMDLLIVRAGAAYLLKYELKTNENPTELLQQMFVVNSNKELELSKEALARLAWLSRPSTQAFNRLRQAQLMSQQTAATFFEGLAQQSRIFNIVYSRVVRKEKNATQKQEPVLDPDGVDSVTDTEIRDLFKGTGKPQELSHAFSAVTTLEREKSQNVSEIKTVKEKAKPKEGEKAYFALMEFTVRVVNMLYPDVNFDRTRVGYYQEQTVESSARGGSKSISFNISADRSEQSLPYLLHKALLADDPSILLSDEVLRVIGHEGVHNEEVNWNPEKSTNGTTHDLRFRRDEYENFRKATWLLLQPGKTGQPRIREIWQELTALYREENLIEGKDFYDRLGQNLDRKKH